MARPRTDQYWVERIHSIHANNPKLSGQRIWRIFEREAREGIGRLDFPSEKTVRTILGRFRVRGESDKTPYRRFFWPESVEPARLSWQESGPSLQLFGYLDGSHPRARPPVRLVKWFCRVSQACPDAPIRNRLLIAGQFAIVEALGRSPDAYLRKAELCLAYAPWSSEEAAAGYEKAIAREEFSDTYRLEGKIPYDEQSHTFDLRLGPQLEVALSILSTVMQSARPVLLSTEQEVDLVLRSTFFSGESPLPVNQNAKGASE